MRKIFLDIGAWDGTSSIFFRENHPDGKNFEIFAFECDQKNIKKIKNKNLNINLIEKAAWVYDGKIKYYYGNNDGGTLYKNKITGNINSNNYYYVNCINISKFIIENFNSDDYIIIKMNCEGSEYDIIPHLKKNNLINWVNIWYVQWHYNKIKLSKTQHDDIINILPKHYKWECQLGDPKFVKIFKESIIYENNK